MTTHIHARSRTHTPPFGNLIFTMLLHNSRLQFFFKKSLNLNADGRNEWRKPRGNAGNDEQPRDDATNDGLADGARHDEQPGLDARDDDVKSANACRD